jgi:hypothetical protein
MDALVDMLDGVTPRRMPMLERPIKRVGWTTVAFRGRGRQLSKERSSDPEADGYERYIGLEHIDPASSASVAGATSPMG